MIDKHTIDGVRPMFEFSFDEDITDGNKLVLNHHEHDDDHEHHGEHHGDHDEHHGDHHGDHDEHHGDHDEHHGDHHGHHDEHHGEHHPEGEHAIHEMHHDHHGEHHGHGHGEHHGEMHHGHHGDHHSSSGGFHFPTLSPDHQGLEETSQLNRAQRNFVGINNNLGFDMFKATLEDPQHKKENLVFSSLSATTSLALVFLGARGVTSWEINELLRLDEMISFNPHLMYKSVTDDFETNEDLDFGRNIFFKYYKGTYSLKKHNMQPA